MTNKEIVNAWCEFLLSDWCSDTFWDNTLNQKNQLLKDLDKLEKIKMWFGNIEKFAIKDKYYAIPKDFIDLAKVVLEDEK